MALNVSNHKALDIYYAALATYRDKDITHEQATRLAFSTLLDTISKTAGWTLVLEQTLANRKRPDGTLYDDVKFPRGYWEAKDTQDNLEADVLLGRDHVAKLKDLLPEHGWHAEKAY